MLKKVAIPVSKLSSCIHSDNRMIVRCGTSTLSINKAYMVKVSVRNTARKIFGFFFLRVFEGSIFLCLSHSIYQNFGPRDEIISLPCNTDLASGTESQKFSLINTD